MRLLPTLKKQNREASLLSFSQEMIIRKQRKRALKTLNYEEISAFITHLRAGFSRRV